MTVLDVKHNPTRQTSYVCPQHAVNIIRSTLYRRHSENFIRTGRSL